MTGSGRRSLGGGAAVVLVALSQAGCQWIGGISEFSLTPEGGTGSGPWCASLTPAPQLCSDFDEGTLLAPWSTPTSNGATLEVDTSVSDSPEGSLRVDVPPLASGASAFAGLTYAYGQPFSQARVEIEYLATTETDDKIIELVWPSGYAVAVVLPPTLPIQSIPVQETVPNGGGSMSFITPVATSSPPTAPNPTTSAWTNISLAVSSDDAGSGATEVHVGDAAWIAPLTGLPPGQAASLTVRVGGVFIDQSPAGWSAHFDNVAFYAQ